MRQQKMLKTSCCNIFPVKQKDCLQLTAQKKEHILLAGFNTDAVPVSVRDRMFQQHQCLVWNIQRIRKQNKDECNTVVKNWREKIKSWGEMCSRALYQVNFESKLYQKTLQLYLFLHKTRKHTKHRGDRTSNRGQKNTSNEIRIKNERRNTKTHEKHAPKHKQQHYNQN